MVIRGVNHPSVRILGMEGGQVRYRAETGQQLTVWPDEIDLLIVDRGGAFADFNQAEQFLAGGEPERAIARYRRTLKLAEEFWEDLVAARLVRACEAAGQLDDATTHFIRVLRGGFAGPPAAARMIPQAIPPQRDGRTARALEQLETALSARPAAAQGVLLELARFEIMRRTGDERTANEVPRIVTLAIPAEARSDRAYTILLTAMGAAAQKGATNVSLSALDDAIRHGPESMLAPLLLFKGEALLAAATSREDAMRAAWCFVRVAVHFPDDPRVPEALQGAARAAERYGRTDQAVELWKECRDSPHVTELLRNEAEGERKRLGGTGAKHQAP